jgi:hypothetical protein
MPVYCLMVTISVAGFICFILGMYESFEALAKFK